MRDANIDFISVGGKRYALDLLNPLDGIAWGNRALSLFGPALGKIVNAVDFASLQDIDLVKMGLMEVGGRLQNLLSITLTSCGEMKSSEVTAIMTEAIQRCYTPQNEALADMAVFNRWFREHPGDLYPLGVSALMRLVKDFFPSLPATARGALLKKTAEKAGATTTS